MLDFYSIFAVQNTQKNDTNLWGEKDDLYLPMTPIQFFYQDLF